MASSPEVYDLVVDHVRTDRTAAEAFAAPLRNAGLRLWLPGRSSPDAYPAAASALAASRDAVQLVGAEGLRVATLPHRPIVVLLPGSVMSPRDIPDGVVIDFRDGFDDPREWSELRTTMSADAELPLLGHAELKRRTAASYDNIADKFAAQWFDHPPVRPLELFADALPRAARVLDAGCGPGHHARFLAARGHDVVGIDLSAAMLQIARSRVRSASFLRMDLQDLRFPPGTFDGIWCAGAAMHIPREEIVAVFRSFRRLVRPGGMVGINMQVGRRSEIVEFENDHRFFEYYPSEREIGRLASRAGLRVVATDLGETGRNTHGLDMRLVWATLLTIRAL